MNDIVIYDKDIQQSLNGIQVGLESMQQLYSLCDVISKESYIDDYKLKLINIATEHTSKYLKLPLQTLSLESISDTNNINIALENLLDHIKQIWKAIVDTFKYIWNKLRSLFKGSTEAQKINVIKAKKSQKDAEDILKDANTNVKFHQEPEYIQDERLIKSFARSGMNESDDAYIVEFFKGFIENFQAYDKVISEQIDYVKQIDLVQKSFKSHTHDSIYINQQSQTADYIKKLKEYVDINVYPVLAANFKEVNSLPSDFLADNNLKQSDINMQHIYYLDNMLPDYVLYIIDTQDDTKVFPEIFTYDRFTKHDYHNFKLKYASANGLKDISNLNLKANEEFKEFLSDSMKSIEVVKLSCEIMIKDITNDIDAMRANGRFMNIEHRGKVYSRTDGSIEQLNAIMNTTKYILKMQADHIAVFNRLQNNRNILDDYLNANIKFHRMS